MGLKHICLATAFSFAAIASGMISGSTSPIAVDKLKFDDGSTVETLVHQRDSVLLLIYRPSDVFACASLINAWQTRFDGRHWSIRVALSREPSELEARSLLRSRIHWVRATNLGTDGEKWKSRELFFVKGRLVDSSTSPNIGRHSLLKRRL